MNYKFYLSLAIIVLIMIACNPLTLINKSTTDAEEKRDRLMKTGISADGEITKVAEDPNMNFNTNPLAILHIHVTPKDAEEFDAVIEVRVSRVDVPRKGDIVTVWYNPKNKDDIIVEGFLSYKP